MELTILQQHFWAVKTLLESDKVQNYPFVLEKIIDFFYEEYSIEKVSILVQMKEHPLYYFQYSTTATKKIFSILYKENCLKLPRKYFKFKELVMK